MKQAFKIRFWDIFFSSIISLYASIKIYGALYGRILWKDLPDFYTGVSIYENHNKYLDIYIYIVYLLLFFAVFAFINLIRSRFFKIKNKAENSEEEEKAQQKFKLLEKIKPHLDKLKNLQYIAAFGFLLLHPLNGQFYPKLAVLTALLIMGSIADVYYRNKNNKGFSPFALTAFLFIFCFTAYTAQTAPSDDHHFGEKFAAFLMHSKFNLEYYKDVMLVHGRMDIFPSALGVFFFGRNNIQGFLYGEYLHRNLIFIITAVSALFIFSRNILYTTPLMLLKVPSLSVMYAAVFLLFLKEKIFNRPVLLFWIYLAAAVMFASYWTTMGLFWLAASLPAFIYISFKLPDKKKHFCLAGLALLALSVIFRNTFFEFLHQSKYYIEGTLYAFGNNYGILQDMSIFEALFKAVYKTAALWFLPVIIIEAFNMIKTKSKDIKKALFLAFSLLFVLSALKYALGRLDDGQFYRIEYISLLFLCILIPYWFYKYTDKGRIIFERLSAFILCCFLVYSCAVSLPEKIKQMSEPEYTTGGSGLFNTGNIKFEPEPEQRLTEIKNFIYSKGADKSFLDLTNRGMHYLYFDKPIPVLYTSFYNSIASKQAQESAERLRKNPPDYILVFSYSILHDNVMPSLRVNALYRDIFLKWNYEYKTAGINVFLVKTDKKPEAANKWNDFFDYCMGAENLRYLPEVWASSLKTLPLIPVIADFSVQNYGKEIKIKFTRPVKVQNLDLLYFNPGGNSHASYVISINGSNTKLKCKSKKGAILTPMDNFPSWLLNDNLEEITIETNVQTIAPEVRFYNRKR